MKKVVAIIKASRISHHFTNRYDVKIKGRMILEIIMDRLKLCNSLHDIILATSTDKRDDVLEAWAKQEKVDCVRGFYEDLINRLCEAGRHSSADIIVNIDGSYPLIMPRELDYLVEEHISSGVWYSFDEHATGLIMGTGSQVASREALEILEQELSAFSRKIGIGRLGDILPDDRIYRKDYGYTYSDYRVNMAVESDVAILEQILDIQGNDRHENIAEFLDNHPWLVHLAQNAVTPVKEIGLEKIVLFPDKLKNILSVNEKTCDFSYPVSVELSLTNRCNLNCMWCSDAQLRHSSMVDLEFDIIRNLILDLVENGCKGVVIEGGGEPTLYDRFTDVVKIILNNGMSIGLITNGVKTLDESVIDLFSWVRVSLDAATRSDFYRDKGVDSFDKVMETIGVYASRNTTCGVGYVLTRNNQNNLEQLIQGLRNIGVSYIHFRPVIDHPDISAGSDLTYLQKFSTPGFSVLIDAMTENRVSGNAECACRAHSLSSVIGADGLVYLCGRLNIYPNWKPIGDLYKNTFHELWFGEERIKQSVKMMNSNLCKEICPECRLTKYNVILEGASRIHTTNFI